VRTLRVIYGPHGAPEFFAPEYIATFFATEWAVHFNSSRTGVRLIGPKPLWARDSGGEAGLHPSNIHDNPYAVGAVDFTGDMPVILGPDGPSLGGFVCPVTVIEADLWQLGQLKAGDKVRFVAVDLPTARRLAEGRRAELATLSHQAIAWQPAPLTSPVVMTCGEADKRLVARLSGDTHLLLEAGEPELDLVLRFRIHALMQALEAQSRDGAIDITPGIRSLQIHFQPETLPLETLLAWVRGEWSTVCLSDDLQVPTRVVHLPLSWDDPACRRAIDKYMTTVRQDAPWCPSNLEFIRRINDLPDEQAVWNTVFDASYLVMGLGDVYLGAPVATPLDPRHRLVTTKYNPARTWTAENSVGIGGAYLCVYGMEGPGGYQFVGRTLQMWNRYREVADFAGKPWLLRFFDQLRFYPVSAEELLQIRRDFPLGRYPLRIEHSTL
ncbi:urea carboxylase, partial [Klebsiella michiganensis]